MERIDIHATVFAPKNKVWDYYTEAKHITNWNFAHRLKKKVLRLD